MASGYLKKNVVAADIRLAKALVHGAKINCDSGLSAMGSQRARPDIVVFGW